MCCCHSQRVQRLAHAAGVDYAGLRDSQPCQMVVNGSAVDPALTLQRIFVNTSAGDHGHFNKSKVRRGCHTCLHSQSQNWLGFAIGWLCRSVPYCCCCCRPQGLSLWEGERVSCWWQSEWTAGSQTGLHSQKWTQCSLEGGLKDKWYFCTCEENKKRLPISASLFSPGFIWRVNGYSNINFVQNGVCQKCKNTVPAL